ncbi:MAG TPA: glycoside hydrolase family 18 protein [Usitatibacter sp.]|nr:glycoside hydrolase family 18 protein [Usitatibacter sp.]
MKRIASVCVASLLAGCVAFAPAPSREVVGYYPAWKGVFDFDATRLTVVNYAFLDICWDGKHGNGAVEALAPCAGGNGSIVLGHPQFEGPVLEALAKAKRAHPHLRLMASVGGWNWSNRFSDMASDFVTRSQFIASSLEVLRRYDFDGIDIDWEYPASIGVACAAGQKTCDRPEDKDNFATLGRELRAALDRAGAADGKRYLFTVAAGADAKYVFDGSKSSAWLANLARSTDWINLMTYDYHGTWERAAYFVAPLARDEADPNAANVESSVRLFLDQGIEPSKLALGAPFYGKGWSGCEAGPDGSVLYAPCAGLAREDHEASFEFAYLVDEGFLSRDEEGLYTRGGRGFVRHWDAAAKAPWLYNPQTRVFIAYDDETSIREKARFARQAGLRGMMFWELSQDRNGVLGSVIAGEMRRP